MVPAPTQSHLARGTLTRRSHHLVP
uniref:Uncharacterized protein n=1 Tax=Arundo donax TaxID=35708 RepID=A0A0A8YPV8_ARUDO